MNNQQVSGFGLVLVSQLSIALLGGATVVVLDLPIENDTGHWVVDVLLGTCMALLTLAVFFMVYRVGGGFAETLLADIRRVYGLFAGYSWGRIATIATLAGVGEELLFRGFLQTWLGQHIAIALSILLVSLVFGLLHYLSHAYFICTFLMSVAFGVGYYLTGSLLMVMVWHGVYDLIALGVIIKFPCVIGVDGKIIPR